MLLGCNKPASRAGPQKRVDRKEEEIKTQPSRGQGKRGRGKGAKDEDVKENGIFWNRTKRHEEQKGGKRK